MKERKSTRDFQIFKSVRGDQVKGGGRQVEEMEASNQHRMKLLRPPIGLR